MQAHVFPVFFEVAHKLPCKGTFTKAESVYNQARVWFASVGKWFKTASGFIMQKASRRQTPASWQKFTAIFQHDQKTRVANRKSTLNPKRDSEKTYMTTHTRSGPEFAYSALLNHGRIKATWPGPSLNRLQLSNKQLCLEIIYSTLICHIPCSAPKHCRMATRSLRRQWRQSVA